MRVSNPNTASEYYCLLAAVLRRELTIFVRYPIEATGVVVVHSLIFGILFVGGEMIAGEQLTESIEGIVVGYFLWMLATTAYMTIAQEIQQEAGWGTLERHFMSPFGFATVLSAKSIAKMTLSFFYATILLAVMMVLTGRFLHIDLLTIVPIGVLTLASAFGVGFAMAGITVLYKNVTSWTSLVQFGFVGLIAAPVFDHEWTVLLPLVQGSALLQDAMRNGTRFWEFTPLSLAILFVTAVGYLAVGYLVFHFSQRRARVLGVLGDY